MEEKEKSIFVNGVERRVGAEDSGDTLAAALRRLGLAGPRTGCGEGLCGACSVLLDGELVRSCRVPLAALPENAEILTAEGLGTEHPLRQAWNSYGAVRCGYCTPGFLLSACALLRKNDNPNRREVRRWFFEHRNICRCTGYRPIIDAVMAAAAVMRGDKAPETIAQRVSVDGAPRRDPAPGPGGLPPAPERRGIPEMAPGPLMLRSLRKNETGTDTRALLERSPYVTEGELRCLRLPSPGDNDDGWAHFDSAGTDRARSGLFRSRMGCDRSGRLTACEYELVLEGAGFVGAERAAARMLRLNGFPYYIPNMSGGIRLREAPDGAADAGEPWSGAVTEQLMDALAEKAGMDPFEFRYINVLRAGQTAPDGQPCPEYPMERIFDVMRPLYRQARENAAEETAPGKLRGVGVACGAAYAPGNDGQKLLYGLFLSEVEVDAASGRVQVLRHSSVYDVGPVGRRLPFEGPAFGGAAECIGCVLGGIGVPTALDVPDDMPLYSAVTGRSSGPENPEDCAGLFRSGGIMSIANAIHDACGLRIRGIPVSPEQLREWMCRGRTEENR